ncbi:hypothetical protein F5888DRAFT_1745434 [Russula emetica]|nr:hypothetical protein F5888DRAFT_1745434 [Russula emetica]
MSVNMGFAKRKTSAPFPYMSVACTSTGRHLLWPKFATQVFSPVEHLTLKHKTHSQSSEEHNTVDRAGWRKVLRSFSNMKTLRVDDGFIQGLSRCLQMDEGELSLDLLPELHELTYSSSSDTGDLFTSFINARQDAGCPITLSTCSSSQCPLILWSRPLKPPKSHRRAASPDFVPIHSASAAFYPTMATTLSLRILRRGVPSDVCTLIYIRFAWPYTFVYPLPIHHLSFLICVPDYPLVRPFCLCQWVGNLGIVVFSLCMYEYNLIQTRWKIC